jgi:hypothetical protein
MIKIDSEASIRRIILFGAASSGERALLKLTSWGFDENRFIFADSNAAKEGKKLRGVEIVSINSLSSFDLSSLIIITSVMHYEIGPSLKALGFNNIVFSQDLIFDRTNSPKFDQTFFSDLIEHSDITNVSVNEAHNLLIWLKNTNQLHGCVAEIGVYKGGTARILARNTRKHVHLFDTFKGLPASKIQTRDLVLPNWLDDVAESEVKLILGREEDIFFHVGIFPESTSGLDCSNFAFVHVDTDIYEGTIDSLAYFYPRLATGGVIITHDYNNSGCPGVKIAFDEFASLNHLNLIELSETQCMIIK